ncbi:MAG: response regulator [Chloroflexales bacterium]|nr:response regulator [Chloroflexales bacterium]
MPSYTVLIVEDEGPLRSALAQIVRANNYAILTAANGEEACAALATTAIDIVLSDARMPRMDGYELLRWMQEHGHAQPVVMLSGHGHIDSAISALRLGAYDYITKPFEIDDVVAALHRAEANVEVRRTDATLRQRNRELAALAAISSAVGSSLDLPQMLQQAMAATLDAVGVAGALVYLAHSPGHMHLHDGYGLLSPLPPWPPRTLRVEGETSVAIGSAQVAQMLLSAHDDCGRPVTIAALEAMVPLRIKGSLRGLVLLAGPARRPVQHDQLGLLQSISHIIGMGVANSRQYGAVYTSALLLEEQVGQRTEELMRSRDLLRTIFDGIPGGLTLLDGDGTVLAANRAYINLLGLGQSVQPLVGAYYSELWPEAHQPDAENMLRLCLTDAQRVYKRARLERPGLPSVVLDRHLFPVLDKSGTRVVQVIEHLDDVTERLALERVIAQTEQLAALGKLAATVAHEVNTPLLAIRGCVSLAASSNNEAERAEYLALAQGELERAAAIIRNMLDFYRSSGTKHLPTDVNALVSQVLQLLRAECAQRGIEVVARLEPLLPPVVGVADKLKQVLLNLVLNALEAMHPAGGTLTISTSSALTGSAREPCRVIVQVHDTGPGIAPEMIESIFDAFVTTKSDGNGLGLAVCRTILNDHEGTLSATNLAGGGACFRVTLPAPPTAPLQQSAA